ncbi:ATP-binding cassette domain-containing protein [Simiduia curdlanivorans]|uniref:ABC transporter ATP-binding protein n=1 Tax=Simiduia curdlanivorans TaxID=1492769 RepID=A0ABV8V7K2_9GAMM|nr:ATP-binding cassette domain-containing protein [Simiduia curdlanivorans]MDN3639783.1 ATP-binding cassette domain-containing protein [Simiduia curdlanivorans]
MILAKNIHKRVQTSAGELSILSGVNVSVADGDSLAIVGASGSGKSTLLGILAGLDIPSEGSVSLDGRNLNELDEDGRAKVRSESLSFVFQSFQLMPGLTALENVMLPLEIKGLKDAAKRAKFYLDQVGLEHRANHYPPQLSGGEQQRVAIARAFASEPKILFADEPTGNLDAHTGAKIIELLFQLNAKNNATLVLVTHEQRLADRCHHQLILEAGVELNAATTAQIEQQAEALMDQPC